MRIWGKIFRDNRMLMNTVITEEGTESRTQKIYHALDAMCYEFDVTRPIWLKSTVREFQVHNKCRFTSDNFVESIEFDYLEFHVIEE